MALKGRTTIQLFDAKSGELIRETHDENMITNAVSNILNPPFDIISTNATTLKGCLDLAMPIQTKAMAGIMIFANRVEEDANHVLPMPEDIEVGHAGGVYSGTNPFRGTYNVSESKALSNGYRHVWDFASDRANGDINCVCLTHLEGGNTGIAGYGTNSDNLTTMRLVCSFTNDYREFVGIIEKDLFCFFSFNKGTITLKYYRMFNSDVIRLSDTADNSMTLVKSVELQSENITSLNDGYPDYRAGWYVDSKGILKLYCYSSNDIIKICYIDIVEGSKIKEVSIPINYNSMPSGKYDKTLRAMSILDNHIILCIKQTSPEDSNNPYEFVAFDMSGNYEKGLEKYTDKAMGLKLYDTKLKSLKDGSVYISEDLRVFIQGGWSNIPNSAYEYKDISPYRFANSTPYYNDAGLFINYCYLASINNLASTVTKTSQQTMKITYEITET